MVKEYACRVCLKKSRKLIGLETVLELDSQLTLLDGFNMCTNLNAFTNDGLPRNLCPQCCCELKTTHKFIEKAKQADKKLRDNLGIVRDTRSSDKIRSEPKIIDEDKNNDESKRNKVKAEFINCFKDPLEESDAEVIK